MQSHGPVCELHSIGSTDTIGDQIACVMMVQFHVMSPAYSTNVWHVEHAAACHFLLSHQDLTTVQPCTAEKDRLLEAPYSNFTETPLVVRE